MNKLNIIGFLLLILTSSCRKDINHVTENETTDPPIILKYTPSVNNITGDLIGQVVDENNQPMSDVKIKMNGENYFTNVFGHFTINDVTMNSLGQHVEAFQNATHFPGSRRFFPQEGKTSRIKIQMIKKEFDNEFSALEGATVLIEGGASVEFKPNSIKDANGNIYEGTVMIASHWLDPLAKETLDKMPGNLQGVNILSEEVALQTFGMIAVELESPNGERLNIADGNSATITMPVSDELLSIAPDEIPLWSFNDEYGLWQEESVATLQNNTYVGKVEHFSFWNCDYPFPIVQVDGTFTDTDGNPLEGFLVEVELGNGSVGTGYTTNTGTFYGKFPANEILTFNLYDNCDNLISSQDFGPFTITTSIGTIAISSINVNNTIIKGTLRDCDNNLIENGMVIVTMSGYQSYFYIESGEFEIFLTACNNVSEIEVYGVNLDNLETSAISTASFNQISDLGDVQVCNNGGLQNYIRIIYNSDTSLVFVNATVHNNGDFTYMDAGVPNSTAIIFFNGTTIGDYSDANFVEWISDQTQGITLTPVNPNGALSFTSFNVTEYDSKLIGTFGGPAINVNTSIQVQIQGDFNINL